MKLEQGPVEPADVEHQANIAAVLGSEISREDDFAW